MRNGHHGRYMDNNRHSQIFKDTGAAICTKSAATAAVGTE
ncbi:MAG: hypothetical protein K0Q63_3786 [Paenibacillus sp.]|jgi:hypothetical protein|nr:hypothetical protein [Paenibacillus sp.]